MGGFYFIPHTRTQCLFFLLFVLGCLGFGFRSGFVCYEGLFALGGTTSRVKMIRSRVRKKKERKGKEGSRRSGGMTDGGAAVFSCFVVVTQNNTGSKVIQVRYLQCRFRHNTEQNK